MSIYTDSPIIEVNTHGLYVEEALKAIDKAVKSAGKGVYHRLARIPFPLSEV